jgi:hypothetical protein
LRSVWVFLVVRSVQRSGDFEAFSGGKTYSLWLRVQKRAERV